MKKELLNDINFVEKFLEIYLEMPNNSLKGNVKVKEIKEEEIIFEVLDKIVNISIKN